MLRNTGVLRILLEKGGTGLTQEEIREQVRLPVYGLRILLESALGIGLVVQNDEKYTITKTGTYIHNDPLTNVNMDFVHDVCYKGLFALDKSIENGKPEGLKVFGEWDTIYEGISSLPAQYKKAGLHSIITFQTLHFLLHYQKFIQEVSKRSLTLAETPENGPLPAHDL